MSKMLKVSKMDICFWLEKTRKMLNMLKMSIPAEHGDPTQGLPDGELDRTPAPGGVPSASFTRDAVPMKSLGVVCRRICRG